MPSRPARTRDLTKFAWHVALLLPFAMRLFSPTFIGVLATLLLAACSPQYNWRDYRSPDAPYTAMFPDKPVSHTREIDLNGMKFKMTMTAVQVDGATFAIGSGEAPDEAQAQAALEEMKTALTKNIGATMDKRGASASATASASASASDSAPVSALTIEANGTQQGRPVLLLGRFVAKDRHFYQVIVLGPKDAMPAEQTEMFLSSFKPN